MPAHLPGLLVIDPSLTANCPAPECEFDVLDLVTVAVGNWLRDGYRCQRLRGGDYAGLVEALTHSRIGSLLPWVDDAAVSPSDQYWLYVSQSSSGGNSEAGQRGDFTAAGKFSASPAGNLACP